MNDLHKDILTGLLFITGLVGFISGAFILSTVLFALAAIIRQAAYQSTAR
jgi:hypothetical protein